MALLASEIQRIKLELGYNLMNVGAEPYIGVFAVFDQIVSVYLTAGASTTSSTAVTAATSATPASITLASATGFASGARVVVDVDDRQETATVQSLSGAVATMLLTKAHTGTYPVTVEGGESLVRELLSELRNVQDRIFAAAATGGLKRAEDIEWYQSTNGDGAQIVSLRGQRDYYRDQLASALGVENMWKKRPMTTLGSVLW